MKPSNEPQISANIQSNAKFLQNIIKMQNTISTESNFKLYKDHIKIKNVDPGHCMMIIHNISMKNLELYKTCKPEPKNKEEEKPIEIGVDLDRLSNIFKGITKKDNAKINYNNGTEIGKLFINIGVFKEKLGCLDTEGMPDPKTPNLNLPGEFIIDTKTVKEFLRRAGKISNYITISMNKEKLTLYAEGDIGHVKVELDNDELEYFHADNNYKSQFSIDYLTQAFRYLSLLFKTVKIRIGNDNPVKITGHDKTDTTVLLAPRIEED